MVHHHNSNANISNYIPTDLGSILQMLSMDILLDTVPKPAAVALDDPAGMLAVAPPGSITLGAPAPLLSALSILLFSPLLVPL